MLATRPSTNASLSVRARPVGGDVTAARVEPPDLVRKAHALTLFIHGFATDEAAARQRYDSFRKAFAADEAATIVEVFWPGDWATPAALVSGQRGLGSAALSVIAYPLQITRARDSARELMDLIAREIRKRRGTAAGGPGAPLALRVVAHSLGCLVTLELLKALEPLILDEPSTDNGVVLEFVALMAAAVPQYTLRPSDFGRALAKAKQVRVYHSLADHTLRIAFPAGQSLERSFPHGWRSRGAVGRHGCGNEKPAKVIEREVWHDHGDYWFDPALARGIANANERIARISRPPLSRQTGLAREDPRPRVTSGRANPVGRALYT